MLGEINVQVVAARAKVGALKEQEGVAQVPNCSIVTLQGDIGNT